MKAFLSIFRPGQPPVIMMIAPLGHTTCLWCNTSSLPPPLLLLSLLVASLMIVPLGPTTFGATVPAFSRFCSSLW
jgi:hypothetical protein